MPKTSPNVKDGIRTCTKCKVPKPDTTEFFHSAEHGTARQSQCRVCRAAYHKQRYTPEVAAADAVHKRKWRLANKDWQRKYCLKRNYGVSQEQYDEMLKRQNGVCAICHAPPGQRAKKKFLEVDHNHTTGRVRSLLCHRCNIVIGMLSESTLLMNNMAAYIVEQNKIDTGVQS